MMEAACGETASGKLERGSSYWFGAQRSLCLQKVQNPNNVTCQKMKIIKIFLLKDIKQSIQRKIYEKKFIFKALKV